MAGKVVVTGATSNIGAKLVESLLAQGVAVAALGRRPEHLLALGQKGAATFVGSLDDAALLERSFAGATGVFAMVPPSYTDNDLLAAFNDQRIVAEPRSAGNTTPTPLDRFAIDTFAPGFRG